MKSSFTFQILLSAAIAFAGCTEHGRVGSQEDGGTSDAGTNLPENATCLCDDLATPCCAEGLFCYAPTPCNVTTADGCHTEGRCEPKLAYGDPCTDPRQCADPEAHCYSTSGCQPPPLGEERCDTDLDCSPGRVCAESYCLLRSGESCSANSECASNRCYGSTDFHCT